MHKVICLVGLNHRTAPVEIRERFALSAQCEEPAPPIFPVGGRIRETLLLSTCNRVEILAVGQDADIVNQVIALWAAAARQNADELAAYVYVHRNLDAVAHLFRVASSLDSMIVGEPQILGQLKQAYSQAVKQGTTGVILNRMLHKAFSVAKRVRTETGIGSSAVSISYAAVELAKRIFGEMERYTAMLIGAGEMAELAALHLLNAGISHIYVANRTFERAQSLAAQFRGTALAFDELFGKLDKVDIVISSTGAPTAFIRAKDLKHVLKRRKNRPMFFIDIAVPRDIDPDVNNLDNVYLYDIDDLKEVVEENLAQRKDEAARARGIVEAECTAFGRWIKALDLQPTIVDLLQAGDAIGRRELAKTLKRIAPDLPSQAETPVQEALEKLVESMVRKLYHEPISFLKRRADEEDSAQRYIDVTRRMFNLNCDPIQPDAHLDRRRKPVPAENDDIPPLPATEV